MKFHYLVRGIILIEGKVLLAHQLGANNTFLIGGHINQGEKAEIALLREIEEEIGSKAHIKGFVGAVEHLWPEDRLDNHEINLIFEVEVQGLAIQKPFISKEKHLEFIWAEPGQLKEHNLQPYPLIECLEKWTDGYKAYWGTSLKEKT